jgi:hypothetical protein
MSPSSNLTPMQIARIRRLTTVTTFYSAGILIPEEAAELLSGPLTPRR